MLCKVFKDSAFYKYDVYERIFEWSRKWTWFVCQNMRTYDQVYV